jgi:hypothetical protein
MLKGFSTLSSFLNPYKRYLEWAVLALVFAAGYKTCDILNDAAKVEQTEQVIQTIPQIIEKTRTITKVIYDSKDPCSNTAIPDIILDELRKQ